jgi:DNA-binding protein
MSNKYLKGVIMSENIDELLEQLIKKDESLSSLVENDSAKRLDINDENINDFILQKSGQLIENGVETIDILKQTILTGFDPGELSAYSDLIKSIVKAIDTVNKINIQNKRSKTQKELKEMDTTARKELPESKGNTNIIIATRDEIMKNFVEDVKQKSIDVTYKEEDNNEK